MDYVAYYRVSTTRQGRTGYGLHDQEQAVFRFLGNEGHLIAEFREIETATGKKERPELDKAIKMCRKHKAKLVCARLDRLYRNVGMMSRLLESDVEFVFADFPNANNFTIQLLAVLAEYEAKNISRNTKAGLQIVKEYGSRSGRPPGNPNGWKGMPLKMGPFAAFKKVREAPANKTAYAFINQLLQTGSYTSATIASALNKNGYVTPSGKQYDSRRVNYLKRVYSAEITKKVKEYDIWKTEMDAKALMRIVIPTYKPNTEDTHRYPKRRKIVPIEPPPPPPKKKSFIRRVYKDRPK